MHSFDSQKLRFIRFFTLMWQLYYKICAEEVQGKQKRGYPSFKSSHGRIHKILQMLVKLSVCHIALFYVNESVSSLDWPTTQPFSQIHSGTQYQNQRSIETCRYKSTLLWFVEIELVLWFIVIIPIPGAVLSESVRDKNQSTLKCSFATLQKEERKERPRKALP